MRAALAAVFGAVVDARNAAYDRGLLKAQRLSWPVVSVGNLRVGGSSKTPFVIYLGKLLQQRHIPFTVLTRGYGRRSSAIETVDTEGDPRQYGDEPLLLARKLQVPVIVGGNRWKAGSFAEQGFGGLTPAHGKSWLHLLDDGFQHRALARDFDIVLVNESDVTDRLLPAGRLRESLSGLARADGIVLPTGFDESHLPPAARAKPVWRVTRRIDLPKDVPRRAVAFCAIARPELFFRDLGNSDIEVTAERSWRDHHEFNRDDVDGLLRLKQSMDAEGFITTEKDAVRLRKFPELAPLAVASLEITVADSEAMLDTILGTIAARLRCRT